MKLYTWPLAPNPRRVHIFLAEKGIEIETVQVDLGKLEHRREDFARVSALQRVPVLELDDGTRIAESVAICRYLESQAPEPNLFGADPLEAARIEMWERHMEFGLLATVAAAFRHLHPAMADLESPQVPAWGEANKPRVMEMLALMDRELATRSHIAGDRFTVADITAFVAVGFLKPARLSVPDDMANLQRWHAAISARPSTAR